MDLRAVTPALNLYNRKWPLRTAGYSDAPAKFIFDQEGRRRQALDSIVAGSTILSGGMVRGSVLGRGVRVHSGALIEDSIIFDNCDIGRRAKEGAARDSGQECQGAGRCGDWLRPGTGPAPVSCDGQWDCGD